MISIFTENTLFAHCQICRQNQAKHEKSTNFHHYSNEQNIYENGNKSKRINESKTDNNNNNSNVKSETKNA